jgi:hypothetical protein
MMSEMLRPEKTETKKRLDEIDEEMNIEVVIE